MSKFFYFFPFWKVKDTGSKDLVKDILIKNIPTACRMYIAKNAIEPVN